MFSVHCPSHDAMVLLGTRSIEDLQVTTNGIHVRYRCTCGHRGSWNTGRRASADPISQPDPEE